MNLFCEYVFKYQIWYMQELISQLQIKVNDKLYVKDPSSSELGQSIIIHALELINKNGLENFTFGKLAKALKTTESSIYRYFENKHKLLIYLTSVYWGWLEYRLVFCTANIENPEDKLRGALENLCSPANSETTVHGLSVRSLQNAATLESSKVYLTKEAKKEDEDGLFQGYERLCERLGNLISEVNKDYDYPNSLASTLIESIHHQLFFAGHIPSLSDIQGKSKKLSTFIEEIVFSTLKNDKK